MNSRRLKLINALTEQLQGQAKQRYFSVQNFKNNETLFKFYTGLQDYETFKVLLDSLMPAAKNLVYCGSKTCAERLISDDVIKHGPKRSLSLEDEFFLVLVRLRLGLLEVDLASRTGVSALQAAKLPNLAN
jgi:hypothetical protein